MTDNSNVDRLVEAFVKIRDHLKVLSDDFKEKKKTHDTQMDAIAARIFELANAQGVESFKTPHGTAFKKKKDWIKVTNWPLALDFLVDEDLKHMLTKNVVKASAKEYMDENDGKLPPGLEYGSMIEIAVRRK